MITLNDYLTSSGKYPERAKSAELTPELITNADIFIISANNFFDELRIKPPPFSSGFRPIIINAKVNGAAKASYHSKCLAGDFEDTSDQKIGKKVAARPDLLRKYGFFLEDLGSTKGRYSSWIHLDLGKRADRPSRIFKP